MDIFKYAESIDWSADYYDYTTGYIYHIAECGNMMRFFGITPSRIRVSDDGKTIGYAYPTCIS